VLWEQSDLLFRSWEAELPRRPDHVLRQCAQYRLWVVRLDVADLTSATIQEVLLEMIGELMVEASLRRR
jgi:hypothetical protein